MFKSILGTVLSVSAGMIFGVVARGQTEAPSRLPASILEIAVTYDAARANDVPGSNFWMQGGSVQLHGQFWRGLGGVADVAGLHTANIQGAGTGLDLVTATFGPRYTLSLRQHRLQFYGQALAGEANGLHNTFPGRNASTEDANGLAFQMGGGMNIPVSRRFAVKAFEASWLRTDLSNATTDAQNTLRVGAGIAWRLPEY